MPVSQEMKMLLKKQQYGAVGKHTRVKVCHWTKSSVKENGGCYKNKFYGIKSHQCLQMTPTYACNFACNFCWRDHSFHSASAFKDGFDSPQEIVDGSIVKQKELLIGFKGNKAANQEKVEESLSPKHVALSLDGEPTLYPQIASLVKEYNDRGMTTFIVTNGSMPERVEEVLKIPPTQMYVSLDAPTKELFMNIDNPSLPDAWERLMQTLDLLKKYKSKTRTVLRLTLIKGMNMIKPEWWSELFTRSGAHFIEVKAYMWVGHSRSRLEQKHMPLMEDIRAFSKELAFHSGYEIADEHIPSRVVLLKEKGVEKIIVF